MNIPLLPCYITVSARALLLGWGAVCLAACNHGAQPRVADTASVGAVSGAELTPANNVRQPEFKAGTPSAGETAEIRRIAPGEEPHAAIKSYIDSLPIAPAIRSAATIVFVDAASYAQVFPGRLFYALRFPQWPVAVAPPAPLASNNLLVFENDKPLLLITGSRQLQEYFSRAAALHGGEEGAKQMLAAWLTLYAELVQDGMFQFGMPKIDSVGRASSNTFEAKGRISIASKNGDSGEITASIVVDENGKFLSARTEQTLHAGIRPICQATKLLDSDPLVRRMAERDLLVMGRSARDYLFQQRSKASPELQARIDQLWRQILEEGR